MKQLKKKYSGVIVPLVTPMNASGNIDKPALKRLMECWLGIQFVF